eukprot:m.133014 g.133014  ORF g.133014 m.133014 type:complete len:864 (-) comp29647_c0_seq1:312-2903(-)
MMKRWSNAVPGKWQYMARVAIATYLALVGLNYGLGGNLSNSIPSKQVSATHLNQLFHPTVRDPNGNSELLLRESREVLPAIIQQDDDDLEPVLDETLPCGELPPMGTITVRHPKYEKNMFKPVGGHGPSLMVSYDSDREFAVPLSGMSFDQDSDIYIFLVGEGMDTKKATVMFKLNDDAPKLSTTGSPYDFMGLDVHSRVMHGRFKDARPLRTARLGTPRCHKLVVTVIQANHTSTKYTASFRIKARAPEVWLISTIGITDVDLVHQFVQHYRDIGVAADHFLITIQAENADDPIIADIKKILHKLYITVINLWIGPFTTFEKFEVQESFGRRYVLQQDWVMHPDVDEHQRIPDSSLSHFVNQMDQRGYTVVFGTMRDRVAFDGSLLDVDAEKPLHLQFPLVCDITKTVVQGAVTKVVLHRGFLMAEEGGYHTLFNWKNTYGRHFRKVRMPPKLLSVDHYKWTSAVTPKLRHREKVFKAQGVRWWVQSARLRKFVESSNNKLDVSNEDLNCRSPTDNQEDDDEKGLGIETFHPMKTSKRDMFTVILMSYSKARYQNQLLSVTYFANLPIVYEVIFVWNSMSDGIEPPDMPKSTLRPIRLVIAPENSLNNRWNHTLYPKTDGILMMDDDIMLPLPTLGSLFARWLYTPDQIVGVVGRNFVDDNYVYPKHCCKKYDEYEKKCLGDTISDADAAECNRKRRSQEWESMDSFCDNARFVLPKGMFFHRKFMRLYTHWKRKQLRTYVDEQGAHCDDVAFNYVVQNATGLPGIVLDDEVIDLPEHDSGLYDGSSETSKTVRLTERTECVQWIREYFGGLELKPFRLESMNFEMRSEDHRRKKISFVDRKYSKLYKQLGQCIAANGMKPR